MWTQIESSAVFDNLEEGVDVTFVDFVGANSRPIALNLKSKSVDFIFAKIALADESTDGQYVFFAKVGA